MSLSAVASSLPWHRRRLSALSLRQIEQRRRFYDRFQRVCSVLAALACAGVSMVFATHIIDRPDIDPFSKLILSFNALMCLVSAVALLDTARIHIYRGKYAPIEDLPDDVLSSALEKTTESPLSRAWRDEAIARGRPLYHLDLMLIASLNKKWLIDKSRAENAMACKQIHGIAQNA